MEPVFAVFGIIVFAVLVLVVIGAMSEYKRGKMWQDIAARHDFRYHASDPFDIPKRCRFPLFEQGHSKKVYNVLDGFYEKVPVILFDYSYKTGNGKNETTHFVSALLAELDVNCCSLVIRPETFLDRFAAFWGSDDIKFEYDQFNRTFNVKAEDKKFAYDICHPDMMEFLLSNRTMSVETRGRHLLLHTWQERSFNAQEVESCLNLAAGFVARIPSYLRNEGRS
jgi:hypothetical protein